MSLQPKCTDFTLMSDYSLLGHYTLILKSGTASRHSDSYYCNTVSTTRLPLSRNSPFSRILSPSLPLTATSTSAAPNQATGILYPPINGSQTLFSAVTNAGLATKPSTPFPSPPTSSNSVSTLPYNSSAHSLHLSRIQSAQPNKTLKPK